MAALCIALLLCVLYVLVSVPKMRRDYKAKKKSSIKTKTLTERLSKEFNEPVMLEEKAQDQLSGKGYIITYS